MLYTAGIAVAGVYMAEDIVELDVRGLGCPMPLLKAKKALNGLSPGALLAVLTSDPGSVRDFRVFCAQSVHELIDVLEGEGEYRFLIRRG